MLRFQLDLIPLNVRKFGEVIESNCPLEGGWSKMEDSYWGYNVTLPEGRCAEKYVNLERHSIGQQDIKASGRS